MRLLAILLLVAVTFAGCASEPASEPAPEPAPESTAPEPTEEPEEEPEPSATAEPEPEAEPSAPEALLEVSTANGTELAINVTINGTDEDGDLAAWTIAFGDGNSTDGTEFPATLSHTYAAAGTYNVTLTVVDSTGLNGTARIVITVTVEGIQGFEYIVELDLPCPQCTDVGSLVCGERQTGQDIGDCRFVPLPEETRGLPFTLESTGGDPEAFFWFTSCGSGTSDSFKEVGPEAGNVPMDAVCVLLWEYGSPASTLTLTIG